MLKKILLCAIFITSISLSPAADKKYKDDMVLEKKSHPASTLNKADVKGQHDKLIKEAEQLLKGSTDLVLHTNHATEFIAALYLAKEDKLAKFNLIDQQKLKTTTDRFKKNIHEIGKHPFDDSPLPAVYVWIWYTYNNILLLHPQNQSQNINHAFRVEKGAKIEDLIITSLSDRGMPNLTKVVDLSPSLHVIYHFFKNLGLLEISSAIPLKASTQEDIAKLEDDIRVMAIELQQSKQAVATLKQDQINSMGLVLKLQDKEVEVEKLKKDQKTVENTTAQLIEAQTDLEKKKEELKQKQKELATQEKKEKQHLDKINRIEVHLQESKTQNDNLHVQLKNERTLRDQQQQKVQNFELKLIGYESELIEKQKTIAVYESKNRAIEQKNRTLNQQVEELTNTNKRLETDQGLLNQKLQSEKSERAKLAEQCEQSNSKRTELEKELQNHQQKALESKNIIEQLRQENAKLLQKIEQQKSEQTQQKTDIDKITKESDTYGQIIKKQVATIGQLSGQIRTFEQEKKDLSERIEELEKNLDETSLQYLDQLRKSVQEFRNLYWQIKDEKQVGSQFDPTKGKFRLIYNPKTNTVSIDPPFVITSDYALSGINDIIEFKNVK